MVCILFYPPFFFFTYPLLIAGLDSAYDVVARSTTDLHSVIRNASHVNEIVDAAAKEVYPWRSRIKTAQSLSTDCVSTGDATMDRILGGCGIPLGSLTEIVGESASGKTQLALQLCLAVQDPSQLHGGKYSLVDVDTCLLIVNRGGLSSQ